jgi:cell division protein FtsQ
MDLYHCKNKLNKTKKVQPHTFSSKSSFFDYGKLSFGYLVFPFLFLGFLSWAWLKLHDPLVLPISTVKISGHFDHLDKDILKEIIFPYATKGFFSMDIHGLKGRLSSMPWVSSLTITRVWPNSLKIYVVEQKPFARWGENALMNPLGEIFLPAKETLPLNLPVLQGMPGEQLKVMNIYNKINTLLTAKGLKISFLSLSPQQNVKLKLQNGVRLILGKRDMMGHVQKFLRIYPKILLGHEEAINYVDMRYPNGLAINWKRGMIV